METKGGGGGGGVGGGGGGTGVLQTFIVLGKDKKNCVVNVNVFVTLNLILSVILRQINQLLEDGVL